MRLQYYDFIKRAKYWPSLSSKTIWDCQPRSEARVPKDLWIQVQPPKWLAQETLIFITVIYFPNAGVGIDTLFTQVGEIGAIQQYLSIWT